MVVLHSFSGTLFSLPRARERVCRGFQSAVNNERWVSMD